MWDRAQLSEGIMALDLATRDDDAGEYTVQAAIAALHSVALRAEDTDWERILALYDELLKVAPSPIVELNRAVAVAFANGWNDGLAVMEGLDGLGEYYLYHAARADLYRRLGRNAESAEAYRRALELVRNPVERAFLERRLSQVAG
jgi:RNA polymerase sigma-70 factor (ECF subfamily)